MTVTTMLMWQIATLGVAAAVLLQFIPWSFGWIDTINVMLTRTLFWYFGHPLVYFWLLPTYICWYVIIPKVIGSKIFSDALLVYLYLAAHVFAAGRFSPSADGTGDRELWKYLQVVLTFMVVVPSLITAFSMFATFELSGRAKGAKGLFGWVKTLPWKDVRFFAPFMGMLLFIPAGAGGLINASHQMNAVVHKTLWVPGHFHLSVATTVALTFFGVAYWLIQLSPEERCNRKCISSGLSSHFYGRSACLSCQVRCMWSACSDHRAALHTRLTVTIPMRFYGCRITS